MDEEGANLRRVFRGIGQAGVPLGVLIAAEQGAPLTPAAASDDNAGCLGHEVSAVFEQRAIDAEDMRNRRVGLLLVVIATTQLARRDCNERFQFGGVIPRRPT